MVSLYSGVSKQIDVFPFNHTSYVSSSGLFQ
nr:MAG TPA: hypothetical protein [Caudoviricetes sp.]